MSSILYTNEYEMEKQQEKDVIELDLYIKSYKKTKGISKKEIEEKINELKYELRLKHHEESVMLDAYILGI
jgi:hypothetical protein